MAIQFDDEKRIFQIDTPRMSYAVALRDDQPVFLYWGERLSGASFVSALADIPIRLTEAGVGPSVRAARYEFSTGENYDYGEPAILPVFHDGTRGAQLRYVSHEIGENTLRILLRDRYYGLEVTLVYRTVGDIDLIERYAEVRNIGTEDIVLAKLRAGNLRLPVHFGYRATHFSGNWGGEYQMQRQMLTQSQLVLENHRGTCSSHQHIPFIAVDPDGLSSDSAGEVFFAALEWSGETKICVEKNFFSEVQICAGWNDFSSSWRLTPGETLATPMLAIGYSGAGFDRMSEILYDWQYDFLCPQRKAHSVRPIIYNTFYPYCLNICEENTLGLIDKAASVGAELFVIDDGWMPGRTDNQKGLGDWTNDPVRFPNGLRPIADACHEKGMLFGLWVEPEMLNMDSDLFRTHPDWIIRDETRPATLMTNQLALNFARDDVRDWAIGWLDRLIEEYALDYVKWDMNRYLTERGWPEADRRDADSLTIRYMQNVYAVWEHLNEEYPWVLFENSASGGGRTDFGMVRYVDRINRSDNSRPCDVMRLHEGFTRLFLPKSAGGAGNISSMEEAPLDFRIHMGMTGAMSIGINLLKASDEVLDRLREATCYFKTVREDLQDAYVYTLISAAEHPFVVFEYLRRDRKSVSLFVFCHGMRMWEEHIPPVRLRGLIREARYRDSDGIIHTGSELMQLGIHLKLSGNYMSLFLRFEEV